MVQSVTWSYVDDVMTESGFPSRYDSWILLIAGGLAQLARAPALQAEGQRFDSVILHIGKEHIDILKIDRKSE